VIKVRATGASATARGETNHIAVKDGSTGRGQPKAMRRVQGSPTAPYYR
jgi:hypothetical protein